MGRSMDIAMKIGSMYWIRAVQGLDCNRGRTPEVLGKFSLFDPSTECSSSIESSCHARFKVLAKQVGVIDSSSPQD